MFWLINKNSIFNYPHLSRVGISGTWWKFGDVSVDTTILNTFRSAPACSACTDMLYLKKLERDVTTTAMAKAILRLKILA